MIVIACVDERNGLMFNHRRQSRDSVVCRDILRECGGKKLYMSSYSGKLFEGMEEKKETEEIIISEEILRQAGSHDVCFIEDTDITGFERQIESVILYKWNRKYPADRYFPLNLSEGSWKLLQIGELQGLSHERITKEIYAKRAVEEV